MKAVNLATIRSPALAVLGIGCWSTSSASLAARTVDIADQRQASVITAWTGTISMQIEPSVCPVPRVVGSVMGHWKIIAGCAISPMDGLEWVGRPADRLEGYAMRRETSLIREYLIMTDGVSVVLKVTER